jgi:hypothetical protein
MREPFWCEVCGENVRCGEVFALEAERDQLREEIERIAFVVLPGPFDGIPVTELVNSIVARQKQITDHLDEEHNKVKGLRTRVKELEALPLPTQCLRCTAPDGTIGFLQVMFRDIEADNRRLREVCIHLMGGEGWQTEYECRHGVPISKQCETSCPENIVRSALVNSEEG